MNKTSELKIQILRTEREKLTEKANNLVSQIKKIDEKIKRIQEFENSRNSKSSRSSVKSEPKENSTLQAMNTFSSMQ